MEIGDRVEWTYKHNLNRKSYTMITKKGTIIRPVKKKIGLSGGYVIVKFDGNKGTSKIHVSFLTNLR